METTNVARPETYLALQTMLVTAGVFVSGLVFVGVDGHLFVKLEETETSTKAKDHRKVDIE